MYELLTGSEPFAGETSGEMLTALLCDEPRPLSYFVAGLPARLQEIVSRALAKDLNLRYQTARDLGDNLKQLKSDLEFAARTGSRPEGDDDILMKLLGARATDAAPPTFDTRAESLAPPTDSRATRPFTAALPPRIRESSGRVLAMAALLLIFLLLGWQQFATRPGAGNEKINLVAVLPFVDENGDPQTGYLSESLTESVIDSLSQLPGLAVMASSTVAGYKDRGLDPRQAGQDLKAAAVVIGYLSQQGDQVMVRTELIRTRDGARLWGASYPVPPAGTLTLQRTITRELAGVLKLRLNGDEYLQIDKRHTQNSEAYKHYMTGNLLWKKRDRESIQKAIRFFQQAIDKDQDYALAHVGLADAYSTLGSYRLRPPEEVLPEARKAVEKALEIDPRLAEARASKGKILTDFDWNWTEAEREFRLAISLQPNYANAHHWYSTLLANLGRFDEAIAEVYRAQELDFLSPATNTQVGSILYRARRYDEAIAALRQTLDLEPDFLAARLYLSLCYLMQRRFDEALAECNRASAGAPDSPEVMAMFGLINGQAGRRDQARRYLDKLKEKSRSDFVPASCFSAVYAGLGEMDSVFEWLEKCFEERSPAIRGLKTDPIYDLVRPDARFDGLLQRAGFAQ